MKITRTTSNLRKTLVAALLVGAAAISSYAGPSPDLSHPTKPITTVKEAKAVKPGDTVVMVCGACKTVAIWEATGGRDLSGEITEEQFKWITVGSKHKCDHCGGTITVVQGKTKDEMQHNCSKCGEGAAFCCAMRPDSEKK